VPGYALVSSTGGGLMNHSEQAKSAFLQIARNLLAEHTCPRAALEARREGWQAATDEMVALGTTTADEGEAWLQEAVKKAAELLTKLCGDDNLILSNPQQVGLPKNDLAQVALRALDNLYGDRESWVIQLHIEVQAAVNRAVRGERK